MHAPSRKRSTKRAADGLAEPVGGLEALSLPAIGLRRICAERFDHNISALAAAIGWKPANTRKKLMGEVQITPEDEVEISEALELPIELLRAPSPAHMWLPGELAALTDDPRPRWVGPGSPEYERLRGALAASRPASLEELRRRTRHRVE